MTVPSEKELDAVAESFLSFIYQKNIVAFYGNMGVGKTTFIRALCKKLGVKDRVTSPSFALVNEYRSEHGRKIYHFDFYRLKNAGELFDMGYEDYFFGDDICLIEWPEKAQEVLPDERFDVYLTENDDGSRTYKVVG